WYMPKGKVIAVRTTRQTQETWLDNRDARDLAPCYRVKFAAMVQVLGKIQASFDLMSRENDVSDAVSLRFADRHAISPVHTVNTPAATALASRSRIHGSPRFKKSMDFGFV
ncbi:hypothetical protein C0992_003631, partial [Termitomyces sp. T32_za158]